MSNPLTPSRVAPESLVQLRALTESKYGVDLPEGVSFTTVDDGGVRGIWGASPSEDSGRVVLYCHGGGYAAGTAASWRVLSGEVGRRLGLRSFSVDYRLAPEFPYPAAIDDCFAAYRWLIGQGFAAADIVVAGDSAGAALAVAVMLRAREAGVPQPACAYLMSPWVDFTLERPSHVLQADLDPIASQAGLTMFRGHYLQGQDPRNPEVSPVFADMRSLPPVLIHVGSHEIMLDDVIALTRQFAIADVWTRLESWPRHHHVFQIGHLRSPAARKALDRAAAFVADVFAGTLDG